VRSIAARLVAVCLTTVALASLGASCASSDESEVFPPEDSGGADTSFGGTGGIGTGGTGGFSGANGGSSGVSGSGGMSGAGATGGMSGASGTSGTGATSGTGGSTGTCNPAFCPTGSGAPCCVTPSGPCGSDNGLGCQQNPGQDI
jgi:hypothetical protein